MIPNYKISSEFLPIFNLIKDVSSKVMEIYVTEFEHEKKDDDSPVTKADLLASKLIIEFLMKKFPKDGIISEEVQDAKETYSKKRIWIIDPIDGTYGFIDKSGEFCIMIGLVENFEPIFGIVFVPTKGEIYFAEKGKGAFIERNGSIKSLKINNKNSNENELVFFESKQHSRTDEVSICKKLDIKRFIKLGSIGIKICKICEGENDLYLNLSSKLGKWDTCAPQIILEESGGMVFDKYGNMLDYSKPFGKMELGIVAITNKFSRDKVLSLIKELD